MGDGGRSGDPEEPRLKIDSFFGSLVDLVRTRGGRGRRTSEFPFGTMVFWVYF